MKSKCIALIIYACMAIMILSGCGNDTKQEPDTAAADESEMSADENEINTDENETTADELLDSFVNGEIMAYYVETDKAFYITDLPNDPMDFTCYSVGDRVDLDNDGEKELIMKGPYGGIYLDVRDGQVYVLDEGDGTAAVVSYTEFDGQTWIVHSDTTHGGRILYDFTLYDGVGHVVDERRLYKEYWDTPDTPDGPDTVYTYGDEQITKEEYDELKMKMLGE